MEATTREEHLTWCKERALEYIENDELGNAYASMVSDLNKHEETLGHIGIKLGIQLMMAGHLSSPDKMRHFIEGFN